MTKIELTITDTYVVDLTDEIMEDFNEANPSDYSFENLQDVAIWALEYRYGWDSCVDHDVHSKVIIPDTTVRITRTFVDEVIVTEEMRREALSNARFLHDYEEYDDVAIALWYQSNDRAYDVDSDLRIETSNDGVVFKEV